MRILLMIASLAESGGAEMLVRNLAIEYARRGHRCHIVYISDAAALGADAAFERGAKDALDAAGVTHEAIGHGCRRNLLRGAWRLRRSARRFAPDVLHMHLAYGLLFQAIGLLRCPTVYTHHNIVFRFPVRLFRVFDRFVDRYVGICQACADLLVRHVSKPITLIYNGVPRDFAIGGVRTGLPRDATILSVGNLTPQKDYPNLIAAADTIVARLAAEGRGVRFRIAGEGAERAALERRIAQAGLGDHIELLGARRDVPALMAEADLLLLSSSFEGFPITLIEAAMSALPAVATDVGGCREIVAQEISGLLVDPGAPSQLAEAALRILGDESLHAALSAGALQKGAGLTIDACADAYLATYEEIIPRSNTRA